MRMNGGVEPEVAWSYPFTVGASVLNVPLRHDISFLKPHLQKPLGGVAGWVHCTRLSSQ